LVTKKYSPYSENGLPIFASFLSNIWQNIYSTTNFKDKFQLTMKIVIQFKVGNGRIIYFLSDQWLHQCILKETYP